MTGATSYKGYTAQQHENAFDVFREFLTEIKPARILEIGTAGGGFTLFLRESLNNLGLNDSKIKSFDVVECDWYSTLRNFNIEINIENLFDKSYTILEKPEKITPFIQDEGITLVLCDGGSKINEFNLLSPLIKNGDFIMAHDYVDIWENYKQNYVDKIWNWCEIEEKYIEKISIEQNLVHYKKETFDPVVWVCKKKNE
jgi:cephalosporin hydroxylase